MAKKRSSRRKPDPAKRRAQRPVAPGHIEAKGAFASTAFQSDAFQTDSVKDQRAAPIAARTGGMATGRAELTLTPEPITVIPTLYPSDPAAALPIQSYLRVDLASPAFKEFNATLEKLFAELRRSNVIAGETRDRLAAELQAGRTLLTAPKPNRDLVDLLLVQPLKYLASQAGPAIIGALASEALRLLLETLSQQPNIPL